MEKHEMRCLLALVAAVVVACGCRPPTVPTPATVAQRVTVIDRTYHLNSISNVVTDAKDIAALEALFPAYETKPESGTAAGYIAQYVFVFELPDGSSIRVVSDGGGELWSTGSGDFPVAGDLKKTVADVD